ncbi:MAG: BadF/BadG/BcrA/BcrD ATPase family protein [Anaerolineaceae bacterium]|jgi:N-acetylglucosamine kinase-like BadF-type ATPase
MTSYFLGADLGGTKTHVMVADMDGQLIGFGESGPGNHETVGYEGFQANLHQATRAALQMASLSPQSIAGSGFGVAGYDWPIEKVPTLNVINTLRLTGPIELVNDAELGLLAGSPRMWGVAVVSGTGCNCRGWDVTRTHVGRITGGGTEFGEGSGAAELIMRTTQSLSHAWSGRGPATALADAFCRHYGVKSLEELLQGLICHQFSFSAADAPIVFDVARQGDPVALDVVRWAGCELGELACTVIRQLHFESLDFDVVEIGGMWEGSPLLSEEMGKLVHAIAPKAHIISTHEPPVMGAVLLGMQAAGIRPSAEVRSHLIETLTMARQQTD